MKTVFKWIAGLLIAAGAVWIAMPFAFMYPFLYVKYSLNPDMTPATMEKIIKEKPKDIYEIEQRLNRKRILPGRNDSDSSLTGNGWNELRPDMRRREN